MRFAPPINPLPGLSSLPIALPFFLPENCGDSVGAQAGLPQEVELLSCFGNFDLGLGTPCDWFTTPNEP